MPVRPMPETTISFNPDAGLYAFSIRFLGKRPHHEMDVFTSLDGALAWCDPHGECVWQEAGDADENRIMVSRAYKPDSVMDEMSRV